MRLNRDGTMQQDGEETRITRFRYENDHVAIGGRKQIVEMEVAIVGEFDRMVAITRDAYCMSLPPAKALKLAQAILRAVPRAQREQIFMEKKQAADTRKKELRRLRYFRSQGNRPMTLSEIQEFEDLEAKYSR